ncbi:MAG: amino acid permease [bacterium]
MEKLTRELGLFEALTIGVGTMICAGIFVLPGIAAYKAGPGAIFSFAICAFVSLFIALCMAELATGMPQAGGGYLYVTRAFGPFIGTVVGCTLWLSLSFAAAFYMMGFGEYIHSFVPSLSPRVLAIIMSVLLIAINYVGTKETTTLQNVIVTLMVIILVGFGLRGLFSVSVDNYRPFTPYGWSSIFTVSALLFVTFCGFAEITAVGEEIKNPQKNIPIALIGSVVIVTFIYLFVMTIIIGLRRYDQLNSTTIFIELARHLIGRFGAIAVVVGGIFATVSSANASIMSASRINFAMGRDKLIPEWLNKVHPHFITPYRSIITTGVLILAMLFTSKLELLAEVAGFLSLILYALVCLACVIMRRANVEWYRPSFRVPLADALSITGFISCLFVMRYMQPIVLAVGLMAILFSFLWYYFYVRKSTQLEGISRILFIERVLTPMVKKGEQVILQEELKKPRVAKYKILVPLANPASERYLSDIAFSLCNHNEGQIDLLHVMPIPEQLVLDHGRNHLQKLKEKKEFELEEVITQLPTDGIKVEPHVVVAHNITSSIMATIETGEYNLVLFGWAGRITRSNLSHRIVYLISKYVNTHVLVLDYKKFNSIKKIFIPYGTGPHSHLGLQLAHRIAQSKGSQLTVAQSVLPGTNLALIEQKRINLERILEKEGIQHAEAKIIVRQSIVDMIVEESVNHDLILMGASNDWIFKQRLFGTITDDVANKAACSVLMVRSSSKRSK